MVEKYKRKSANCVLKNFCHLAKEHDFLEVTEWYNGEGYDVSISSQVGNNVIQLTEGELDAINHLISVLRYEDFE